MDMMMMILIFPSLSFYHHYDLYSWNDMRYVKTYRYGTKSVIKSLLCPQ